MTINEEQFNNLKTVCCDAFADITPITTTDKCLSVIQKISLSENLKAQDVANKIFDALFEHYESDLFTKRYDIFVDDDMPDMTDDLYTEMYENYVFVLNKTHEMNIS
jgi:hypothetical protein